MTNLSDLISVGNEFISPGRTFTEAEFSLFADLTWDVGSVHCDQEFMKNTQFGERIFPGPCLMCAIALAVVGGLRGILYQDKN